VRAKLSQTAGRLRKMFDSQTLGEGDGCATICPPSLTKWFETQEGRQLIQSKTRSRYREDCLEPMDRKGQTQALSGVQRKDVGDHNRNPANPRNWIGMHLAATRPVHQVV